MKKPITYILFLVFCFTFIISTYKADSCNYKEQAALNKEANNVKLNYEVITLTLPDGYKFTEDGIVDSNGNDVTKEYFEYYNGKYIKISVTNLPENFYFKIDDAEIIKENNNKDTYDYNDKKDGVIELETHNLEKYKNLKFSIYTNDCGGKRVLDKYLKLPRSNQFHGMALCEDIKDYKYCQEYLFSNVSTETILKKINQYRESLEEKETIKNDNKINWQKVVIYAGIGVAICGIVILVTIVIIRKLRAKRI